MLNRKKIRALAIDAASVQSDLFDQRSLLVTPSTVEALENTKKEDFDVILLDSAARNGSHILSVKELHKKISSLPIIVLNIKNEADAKKVLDAGASDYILKCEMNQAAIKRTLSYAIERSSLVRKLEEVRSLGHKHAFYDALTDLPNRVLFGDRLQQAISQGKRTGNQFGLLFLDMDGFKRINDSLGHHNGDLLLQAAAKRLTSLVREGDTVARLGGDEFVILLIDLQHEEDAARVARKIIIAMSEPFKLEEHDLATTVSIGISLYPGDGHDGETLLKNADTAMYRAKAGSENDFNFFLSTKDSSMARRLKFENELRLAITDNQLTLYYQPQIDMCDGKIVGAEALVRWQHPEQGLLAPAKFIPVAEESGLIVPLGEWVLRAAVSQYRDWLRSGLPRIRIAVNISARQFLVTRLSEIIAGILQEIAIDPRDLVLEITETGAMQNIKYTILTLRKLRDMGVKTAMDDFGTGYASLNYLKKFPLDILKIDRCFISGLHTSHEDWAIVSAIIAMAQRLSLKVLAEGVEHEEQITYLQALKCDEYQGFYASRPLPAEAFAGLLGNEKSKRAETERKVDSFWHFLKNKLVPSHHFQKTIKPQLH